VISAPSSRESAVRGRLFLTGHEDRATPRPRGSLQSGVRESSTLPNRQHSAADAREITARMCTAAHLSEDTRDRAVLLTSEVVTNALLHTGGQQRLTVTTRSDGVRVEVGDDSSDLPVLRPSDDEATGGRGVQLLELWSSSWGARTTTRGKCVWFDIRSAPEPLADVVCR
jgi:anti-sigma regulatory factor (Ser/Thr protein kinase)